MSMNKILIPEIILVFSPMVALAVLLGLGGRLVRAPVVAGPGVRASPDPSDRTPIRLVPRDHVGG